MKIHDAAASSIFTITGSFMIRCTQKIIGLLKDESGAEVLEYALILGLIVVGAIAVIGSFGTKVLARWSSVNSSV